MYNNNQKNNNTDNRKKNNANNRKNNHTSSGNKRKNNYSRRGKNKYSKIIGIIIALIAVAVPYFKSQDKDANYQAAQVVRVVDGDTIKVDIDGEKYKVRMIGVDTPETVHPKKGVEYYGKAASNFTKKELTDKTVYLQKDVSDTDKYGRLLRYVWINKPSSANPSEKYIEENMYNAILVKRGFARVFTMQPDSKYADLFVKLERDARQHNTGLWGEN